MTTDLNGTFFALADPLRRSMLEHLTAGEASVSELSEPFSVSLPAVLKHLRVLEKVGLVRGKKQGRVHRYQLIAQPLNDVAEWIAAYSRFWRKQLDQLDRYLSDEKTHEEGQWKEARAKTPSGLSARSTRHGRKFTRPGRKRSS
jgi:DNA-binding transcriptional ArsR family regulator